LLKISNDKHIMKKIIFLIISSVIIYSSLSAQHTNIMISDANGCNEPAIIINPSYTDELYAGANLNNYYYSTDAGLTWTSGILVSPQYGVWGDPVLICDTEGAFYFFHLSNPVSGNWIDRIVCQKVTEPGGNWNNGTYMGLNGDKAQDKEWATVDRSNNHIYVTWTQFDEYGTSNPDKFSNIMFSKSVDGGESWSEAMQINEVSGDCVDDDNTTEGAVPCVGPNGQIYVSWAGPEGLVFDRSLDQGETWLNQDIFVDEFPTGWAYNISGINRANGLPVTLCDTSGGEHHGTIYINWSDQRNGLEDTDVWMVKSTNGGNTWSQPLRVNDDPPGRQQFFTWMAVDQVTGYVYVVFYDRRNYDDLRTDVYMAMSTDGGESFTNFRISESPFIPNSGIFFGDYTNITAHNNVIRPIWIRLHNGQRSAWTALVNPIVAGVPELTSVQLNLGQNYPNPFSQLTYFPYKLRKPATVTLKVYDQTGRQIAVLIDRERKDAGKYEQAFSTQQYDLTPGVYYFSLTSDQQVKRRKMVVIR